MKVKVLDRFVAKGRLIRHPGEVIDVSDEQAAILIQRGIAEPIGNPGPDEFGEGAWKRKKPCCPERRQN